MSITAVIEYRGLAFHADKPGGLRLFFKRAVRQGFIEAGEWWRRKHLPRHFTERAGVFYSYQKRTLRHQARKKKKFGHRKPLVFTGQSRDAIMADRQPPKWRKRGGIPGVEVRIKAPKYFYQFNPATGPNKLAEVTQLASSELAVLARVVDRRITAAMNNARGRKRKKVA